MGSNEIPDQSNSSDSAMSAPQNRPMRSPMSASVSSEYSSAAAAEQVNAQYGNSMNGTSPSLSKRAVPNSTLDSNGTASTSPNASSQQYSMAYPSELQNNPAMRQSSQNFAASTEQQNISRAASYDARNAQGMPAMNGAATNTNAYGSAQGGAQGAQASQASQAIRGAQDPRTVQVNQPNQATQLGGQKNNNIDSNNINSMNNSVDDANKKNKADKNKKDKNDKKTEDSDKDKKDSLKNAKTSTHWAITISLIAIVCVVAVIALLFSIFVWPRWTERPTTQGGSSLSRGSTSQPQEMPATASMATPLPPHPSVLLQAMPDVVGIYARKEITPTSGWAQLQPNESYSIAYVGRNPKNAVTLLLAQWTTPEDAKTQFNVISGELKGDLVRSGNVSVNGHVTGDYRFLRSSKDHNEGVAVWRNSTCVFEVRGPFDQVRNFYQEFPL